MKTGTKVVLILLLGLIGVWLGIQNGFFGDPQAITKSLNDTFYDNQSLVFFILAGGVLLLGIIISNKGIQKNLKTNLPNISALSYSKAFNSMTDEDEEYETWLHAGLESTEFYHPAKVYPVDTASGQGLYFAVYDAKTPNLPHGLKKKEVIIMPSGIISKPFMEKSRLLGRADYDSLFILNRGRKWGDLAYEVLGTTGEHEVYNQFLLDNPDLVKGIDLTPDTQKALTSEKKR